MTRNTNARIAGFTFLFYIAAGVLSMVLFGRATSGIGIAEKLSSIAQHTTAMGVVFVLGLLQAFSALTLGVTLYAITREQDSDLAMAGLIFRVGEASLSDRLEPLHPIQCGRAGGISTCLVFRNVHSPSAYIP